MMTKSKARAVADALVKLRNAATDEQAIEVAVLYPEWKEECEYKIGDRVVFGNVLYKTLQDHTSQSTWTPDAAPSLFAKVLVADDGTILPWEQPESTNPYMKGDKVSYNGQTWVSIVDNNVWSPDAYGWEIVE